MQQSRSTKTKRKARAGNLLEMQGRLIDAVGRLGEAIIDFHAAPAGEAVTRREQLVRELTGVYTELSGIASHVGFDAQAPAAKAATELQLAR